jgi:hypothetical protein
MSPNVRAGLCTDTAAVGAPGVLYVARRWGRRGRGDEAPGGALGAGTSRA